MSELLDARLTCANCEQPNPEVIARLSKLFSARSAAYIMRVLTPGEIAVVTDPADALIIARIKRMSDRKLRRFERLVPAGSEDHRLFASLQLGWLRSEQYLLSTRLGRNPTHRELFADFMRNHNGLRFRAYFAMKHRNRMRPCHREATRHRDSELQPCAVLS